MGKYLLTPAQKRELNVRIRDLEMMEDSLPEIEFQETFEKLVNMRLGRIDYEEMQYNVTFVSREEIAGEELFNVRFYGDIRNERAIKQALQRSFNLVHVPNACKKGCDTQSMPEMRQWLVKDVTNEAVSEVFHANKDLFYSFTLVKTEEGLKREKKAAKEEAKQQKQQQKQQDKKENPKRKYTKRGEKKQEKSAPKRKYTRKNAKKEETKQQPLFALAAASKYDYKYTYNCDSDSKFYGYSY